MGDNIFARMLADKDKPKQPFNHPPVEEAHTRLRFDEIVTETEKARLFVIKNRRIWIPKSCHKYHFGNTVRGVEEIDRNDVIDVDNEFYKQNINI